jgi:CrcB protein
MTPSLSYFLYVMAGCALGGATRFGIMLLTRPYCDMFPYATLTANIIGCFGIGVAFIVLAGLRPDIATPLRLFLMVGFCGGLSTLSAFTVETLRFLELGNFMPALINTIVNIAGGLFATYLGMKLARIIIQ